MEYRKKSNKRKRCDFKTFLPKKSIKFVENLFEKKFDYEIECSVESLKRTVVESKLNNSWSCHDYMNMKDELNSLKNELNDKDNISWHKHTRECNPASKIAPEIRTRLRPELCTQAWCKFYEIASRFLEVDPNRPYFSVHLCEAPGAFVTSLNQYLYSTGKIY